MSEDLSVLTRGAHPPDLVLAHDDETDQVVDIHYGARCGELPLLVLTQTFLETRVQTGSNDSDVDCPCRGEMDYPGFGVQKLVGWGRMSRCMIWKQHLMSYLRGGVTQWTVTVDLTY